MIPEVKKQTIELGDGRNITIETGKLAKQAHGSAVVQMGDTMLLATAVSSHEAKEGIDFLPLTVDYREKFYACGRIPGGFLKREARPSDDEILTMRLVDRVLRPLFPKDYHADTQIMISLIAFDGENLPDALAGLAASAALSVSDIPFNGPISEVRVGRINGTLIINPSASQLKECELDMVIGASSKSVVMVEGEMDEVSESEMLEAIQFAHNFIKKQCEAQKELANQVKTANPKREYCHEIHDENLKESIKNIAFDKFLEISKSALPKQERIQAFNDIKSTYLDTLNNEEKEEKEGLINTYFHDVEKMAVRSAILKDRIRLDGRKTDEIRPIWCEVDYLPTSHGSAIFTRGETQSLTTVTLGTKLDENRVDNVSRVGSEKFYLHYNFPPFSTGEARPIRGVSRREVGHGNLAERALKKVLPEGDKNPYTIRVVSDILESNGSSSMATVCAGTLALMDAGIKINKPVSGIAMGLITNAETGEYAVLSDILGDEDHLGDMDFKVTGTKDGITACQMDIKIQGLTYPVLEEALEQAKNGRLHILEKIEETIANPREVLKSNAPKIILMDIKKKHIGAVIGPGGKVIQELQAETETTITVEEIEEIGKIEIFGTNQEKIDIAVEKIKEITFEFEPEIGSVYSGKVKSIMPYGAFVEIAKGVDGLLHISELDWKRVEKVEEYLKEGDTLDVKLIGVDNRSGKIKLSKKALTPKPDTEN